MRYPLLVIYERDGKAAALLRPLAEEQKWPLKEARRPEECLTILRSGGTGVLVIKVGREDKGELALVEQAAWEEPRTAVVVVGEVENRDLAGLAWDLGASYVSFPPASGERLWEVVADLMRTAGRDQSGEGGC
jgi:DNA-binding NtrC family response regulator